MLFSVPTGMSRLGVGNRDAALFGGMLELDMATLLSHLDPPISLKSRDNVSTFHGVYLYTLGMLVNI
jgi:hypothetical protein